MAVTPATLLAERWLDEVIVLCSIDNTVGAQIAENFTLPAGIGDVAILSVLARAVNIATVPGAATAPRGAEIVVVSQDGSTTADVVGVAEWLAVGGSLAAFDQFSAHVDPEALCLWRQGEQLRISSPEMDVNAAPTGDLRLFVKCVRVKPVEAPAGPIQLVR